MSNPWNTTPADVALTPFHQLLQSFEVFQSNKGLQNDNNNGNGYHNDDNESKSVSVSQPQQYSSPLVSKLREADKVAYELREQLIREKAIEERPEIKTCYESEKELFAMFNELSSVLENFEKGNQLQTSYLKVFNTSQIVWDDISHENKGKLVSSIRSAIRGIFKQIQVRGRDEVSFAQHQKVVSELIERTNIFNEEKEFDDFQLEDLYDLLTECCNSLELIKRHILPTTPARRLSANRQSSFLMATGDGIASSQSNPNSPAVPAPISSSSSSRPPLSPLASPDDKK
jgi:hypothetical protein